MQGIAYWIKQRSRITPDRLAIIAEGQELTYREMGNQVDQIACYLKHQLKAAKGDRIGILSQNSVEYLLLLFAVAKIGAIAVPLNIRLTSAELGYQIADSGIRFLFTQKQFRPTIMDIKELKGVEVFYDLDSDMWSTAVQTEPIPECDEGEGPDRFIICYTSGTTGKPKGAVLTQENMFWNAINNITALDITSSDRSIVLLPLFHIGGIGLFAFPTLLAGGTVLIPGKFGADRTLKWIEQYKVTIVMGVPAIHDAIRHSPLFSTTDLRSVRWFYNGGAPCPHELILFYQQQGLPFGQGFGLTETSPTVCMLTKEDAARKIGSIGKPALFCEIRLLSDKGEEAAPGEIGELLVKGPNVMKEYWNLPVETARAIRNGWFYTGDLARLDEEGFVYIVGRHKEMIISGGENIYPLELEQTIAKLEGVDEVAVIGVPDEKWGEVAKAFIVPSKGHTLTSEQIKAFCEQRLARYKIPKHFVFLKELPRNATGKILKKALSNMKNMENIT